MGVKDPIIRLFSVFVFIFLTVVGLIFSIFLLYAAKSTYMWALAFSFMILTIVSGMFNIITSYWYYKSYLYEGYFEWVKKNTKPLTVFPSVAIAMPVYNEDPALVEKNMLRIKDIEYPADKLAYYLLDDSSDEGIRNELEAFSRKHGITYLHRTERTGFKAGALNNMLKTSKEEFLAIFDYDEYVTDTTFLKALLPFFGDKRLSFVQTKKQYSEGSFFSNTVNLFDAFFFKFIQPARALNNTAIFAGSCGIIRSSHLKKIGGFPEYIIEDTFFSFESDMHGYKSLYVPQVFALGEPLKTFSALVKQQWRYNYGDTQFLVYIFRKFKRNANAKTPSPLSSIDYMTHGFGLNYVSIMLLLFTVLSIFIVFSQFPISDVSFGSLFRGNYVNLDLEILGFTAFSISIIAPVILTKMHFGSVRKGIMIFLLNFALAFMRTKAAIHALFLGNKKVVWERDTNSRYGQFLFALRNSITEIIFSAVLIVLGIFAVVINNISGALWLMWYGLLYISTFYMFYKYG